MYKKQILMEATKNIAPTKKARHSIMKHNRRTRKLTEGYGEDLEYVGEWNALNAYEKMEQLLDTVGAPAIVDELTQWMTNDQLNEFCDDVYRMFDLDAE